MITETIYRACVFEDLCTSFTTVRLPFFSRCLVDPLAIDIVYVTVCMCMCVFVMVNALAHTYI